MCIERCIIPIITLLIFMATLTCCVWLQKPKETINPIWSPSKFGTTSVVIKGDFKKPYLFIYSDNLDASSDRSVELADFLNNYIKYTWIQDLSRINKDVMSNNDRKIVVCAGGPDSRIIDMLESRIKNEAIFFDLEGE